MCFFFQAEDGIRDFHVTGVQTCALPISTRKQQDFSGDVVGRFRSGYQVDNRPQSLGAWRVTTGDPEVAARVHELFGGDSPQEWRSEERRVGKGSRSVECGRASSTDRMDT